MKIEKVVKDVYNVRYKTNRELAKAFVRISGYSENPEFKGKFFTLDEFKEWYIANSKKGKKQVNLHIIMTGVGLMFHHIFLILFIKVNLIL